ncbi:MAG: 30S ribosomal protein S1 [Cyclobacteriaceae bacterium]|nr:30S ribosomal protein S1 [Cyclobacteriaceae bacterium]
MSEEKKQAEVSEDKGTEAKAAATTAENESEDNVSTEKSSGKKESKKEDTEEKVSEPVAVTESAQKEEGENAEAPVKEKSPAKTTEKKQPKVEEEEFNWEAFETRGFGEGYTRAQKEEMAKTYENTLTTIEEKQIVKGVVVSKNDRDIIINIGFKSDGLVSATEFRDFPNLKEGDEVEVYIEEQEDVNGQLVLSRRKAKIVNAWESIQKAHEEDLVIESFVKRRTKGGLIVDIFGVEAFLPGSQIDVKPIRDFDIFVNKTMEVKVVKINFSNDNVVVSHKVLIEKDIEEQKAVILNNLEKGQVLEGTIKNMTNFGVFIDLGGVDGLLHITDISWGRINHPDEVLKLDETVKVVVLDFDEDKKRISLGMKQLTEHPWDKLDKTLDVGSKMKGKIVNVADYGAFLEIMPGVEGLIHVSEMSWSQHLRNPQDFISIGDELEAIILTIDRDERKMSLGIKQLTEDPWTKQDVLTKYAVNTKHKGVVRNLTNFGLFIELEEGIDGLVHVSDLSWTKKIKHPSEFVKVGEELEVVVLELDADNRRLALSHKHLEENPWNTFETVFTIGSVHKCSIIEKTEKGAVLELPYGIEGICSAKNLSKEDGSKGEVGESLDFRVLEFQKDEKKIVLSHMAVYNIEEGNAKKKKKKSSKGGGSAIDKINADTERDTLGDLEALSSLKEKMNKPSKTEKPVAEEEKPKKAATKAKSKKEEPKAEEASDNEDSIGPDGSSAEKEE